MTNEKNEKQVNILPFYNLMNELKKHVDNLPKPKRKLSDKTEVQYRRDSTSMNRRGLDPFKASKTKNTFYKYRAAWIFTHKEEFYKLHKDINKETDKSKKIEKIKELELLVDELNKYPPDPKGEEFKRVKNLMKSGVDINDIEKSKWRDLKEELEEKGKIKNHSKKYQKLPNNWSERYLKHLYSKKSKYTSIVAFLAISGCRPAELEGGVSIGLREDGTIKIAIQGKKVTEEHGQEFREFAIKSDSVEYQYLTLLMEHNDNQLWLQIDSAKNLGKQMAKFSKQLFPRSSIISPYTYRHNFAKQIKANLKDTEEVAKAMGHTNDKSQRYYANAARNGGGGLDITEVEGTRDVVKVSALFPENGFDDESGLSLR